MAHTEKTRISTDAAPNPAHMFSQAVSKGGLLQVSGQGPVDAASNEYLYAGDVQRQTALTLENVRAIVEAAGASMEDVVMLRVYLTRREDFAVMNTAYSEFVNQHVPSGVFPARTTVFTGLPREEMLVEIDALAVVSRPEPIARARRGRT